LIPYIFWAARQQADLSLTIVRPFNRAFVTACPPPMFPPIKGERPLAKWKKGNSSFAIKTQ